jgi:ferrous iron transport protein B
MEIGLIGQPNAGKSALFTKLTGIGAISSNYPGTTVEFQEGSVLRHGVRLNFHDLPGTYSPQGFRMTNCRHKYPKAIRCRGGGGRC